MTLLALQDLFRHHRERATGLWKLGTEPNRTVFFESGDIVFAQSTHTMDRLTYLLVERGKLTQAQLDYALANLKPGLSIGKNLIEMGFITQRDLLDVARAQVERVVQGALGTPDQVPTFEAKELDASVVRLPVDSAQLLLNSLLNLQDRERLLELLGPLNQVVVLQGKRLMEMTLPPDLAKLPPLLDGTHTLLELSREALAEPLRLGTFALFLREIGWARLHEMPPLDRQALDMAFTSELEPLSPPLPGLLIETVPSLFSTIEDAARPTTNLEHLSRSLDDLPEPLPTEPMVELFPIEEQPWPGAPLEPVHLPERVSMESVASEVRVEPALMDLPTPSMELPEIPPSPAAEPEVMVHPSTMTAPPGETPIVEAPALQEPEAAPRASKGLLIGLIALLLLALGGGGWWWFKSRPAAPTGPETTAHAIPATPEIAVPTPVVPTPPEPPKPEPANPEPAKPEPPKPEPPKPEPPKAAPAVGISIPERVEALRKGDLELAIKQGQRMRKEAQAGHWSLRLEIACQGETLRRAVDFFPDGKPNLFIIPMTLRDGRTCYQLLYGAFPSKASAEKQASDLPKAFHEGGNRPKAFKMSEIPDRQ